MARTRRHEPCSGWKVNRRARAQRRRTAALAFPAAVLACGAWLVFSPPSRGRVPGLGGADTGIDLSKYHLTFDDEFNSTDVPGLGEARKWFAELPWPGNFGDAKFLAPDASHPFAVHDGVLRITMDRDSNNQLQSGLLAANNAANTGFSQAGGGYFEVRAKLPTGDGTWPAFWLGSLSKPGQIAPEIDVIEYYGHDPSTYMATLHLWKDGKDQLNNATVIHVPAADLTTKFHTFGVSVDSARVSFYLDRHIVAQAPSSPDLLKPSFPIVNLAAGGGWPVDKLPATSTMQVDYVRVYRHN